MMSNEIASPYGVPSGSSNPPIPNLGKYAMTDKYEFRRMESRDIALEIVYLSQKLDNSGYLSPSQIPEMHIERHVLCRVLGYSGWDSFLKHGQNDGFLKVEKSDWGVNYTLV